MRSWREKVSGKNAVALCTHSIHAGAMSKAMVEQHKCISKECPYYVKLNTNTYWRKKRHEKPWWAK